MSCRRLTIGKVLILIAGKAAKLVGIPPTQRLDWPSCALLAPAKPSEVFEMRADTKAPTQLTAGDVEVWLPSGLENNVVARVHVLGNDLAFVLGDALGEELALDSTLFSPLPGKTSLGRDMRELLIVWSPGNGPSHRP